MLKVTMELYPFGSDLGKKTLYEIKIVNNLKGTVERGNYDCTVINTETNKTKKLKIVGFHRKLGSMALLREVINKYKEKE